MPSAQSLTHGDLLLFNEIQDEFVGGSVSLFCHGFNQLETLTKDVIAFQQFAQLEVLPS